MDNLFVMKNKLVVMVSCLLLALNFSASVFAAADDIEEATQTVEKRLAELVMLMKETVLPTDRAEAEEEIRNLLESNLVKIVDFRRIVKRVMGRHFSKATKDQRNNFLAVFQDGLVASYSKFMANSDLQAIADKIQYKVLPAPKSKRKGKAQVTVVFKVESNSYEAVHSMFFDTKRQGWFLENIVVGGVNLGINYRTQFDRLMTKNQNNYEKVIEQWAGESQS